jgi:hypothetical protein
MKKRIVLISALLVIFCIGFSQNSLLPIANQNLVTINPSFSGSNGLLRNQSVSYYRPKIFGLGNYSSINNCTDVYIKKMRAGVALSYFHDDEYNGYIKSNHLALTYAQHIFLFNKKLKIIPSVMIGYGQKRMDVPKSPFSGRIWDFSPYIPLVTPSRDFYNLGFGLLFTYKGLYFGGTLTDINRPDLGMFGSSKNSIAYSGNISYNLKLGSKYLINFFTICKRQNSANYLHFGMQSVLAKHILLGIEINSAEIYFGTIGYRNNYFSATFGYALSGYYMPKGNVFGSWSLGLSYNLRSKEFRKELTNVESW